MQQNAPALHLLGFAEMRPESHVSNEPGLLLAMLTSHMHNFKGSWRPFSSPDVTFSSVFYLLIWEDLLKKKEKFITNLQMTNEPAGMDLDYSVSMVPKTLMNLVKP